MLGAHEIVKQKKKKKRVRFQEDVEVFTIPRLTKEEVRGVLGIDDYLAFGLLREVLNVEWTESSIEDGMLLYEPLFYVTFCRATPSNIRKCREGRKSTRQYIESEKGQENGPI